MKKYRPTNELTQNMQLPILFIVAKTFGAAWDFVQEHDLERKLNGQVRDIVYLWKPEQLRGLRSTEVRVLAIPRYAEYEHHLQIKEMMDSRNVHIVHAVRFLNNLENNIPI